MVRRPVVLDCPGWGRVPATERIRPSRPAGRCRPACRDVPRAHYHLRVGPRRSRGRSSRLRSFLSLSLRPSPLGAVSRPPRGPRGAGVHPQPSVGIASIVRPVRIGGRPPRCRLGASSCTLTCSVSLEEMENYFVPQRKPWAFASTLRSESVQKRSLPQRQGRYVREASIDAVSQEQ